MEEGREPRPHPHPWAGGPGTPRRIPSRRLLRVPGRSPQVGAWRAGLGSGAHSHPWGVGTPGLREARGAVPFGLPADRNPGAALSFGERSRRRGPRARGGAEPGRGRAGARGGRGRREKRGRGARGSVPRRVAVLGRPRPSTGSARPARPPPPVPAPAAAAPRAPPRPWARSLPPPLGRDPLGISRKNVYCERKRAKRTKTQGGGGNSEGGSRRSWFASSRTWSRPLPSSVVAASMV